MPRMKKVLLVVPNLRWADWDESTMWHFIPYNLCLLAAMVQDMVEVTILDAYVKNMTQEDFTGEITKLNPDVVGITVLMDQYADAGHEAAKLAKLARKEAVVVMGGVYATMNPDRVMADPNVDYAVIGEGEYVFRDLLTHLLDQGPIPDNGLAYRSNGQVVNTGHSDFIKDLDAIPFPAYHLIDTAHYFSSAHRKSVDSPRRYPYARMTTSRGCPFGCVFCQVESIMGRRFRARSVDNVLKEIEWLRQEYGVSALIFDDDNLYTNTERARGIFQGMIDRHLEMPWSSISVAVFRLDEELLKTMAQSGCGYIDIAIESGAERVLKEVIRKPVDLEHAKNMVRFARGLGIYVAANFIVGFPTETWDEIRATVRFAEELDADYAKVFAAVPLRKTKLWALCEKEKCFKKGFSESGVRWSAGQIETKDFTANDLTILRAYEWDRINFSDPQKRRRTAEMMGISEDELLEIRRRTLRNVAGNLDR